MRPLSKAFEIVRTMASWPIRSSKLAGRYLRASTRYPSADVSAGAEPEAADFLGSLIVPSASRSARKRGILANESRNWWEADERPEPRSLGLLPSGPDPVGEWLVHRQPPATYIGPIKRESKQPGNVSASFPPKESSGFVQWIQGFQRTGRCIRSSPRIRFQSATCR